MRFQDLDSFRRKSTIPLLFSVEIYYEDIQPAAAFAKVSVDLRSFIVCARRHAGLVRGGANQKVAETNCQKDGAREKVRE